MERSKLSMTLEGGCEMDTPLTLQERMQYQVDELREENKRLNYTSQLLVKSIERLEEENKRLKERLEQQVQYSYYLAGMFRQPEPFDTFWKFHGINPEEEVPYG
jgi:FtsZ-binding cell division protein ZapB